MVTGDIAPIRMNGVTTQGWPARVYSKRDSSIRPSQCRGELQLISEIDTGVFSIASRPPNRISPIRIVSAALTPETTLPM